MRKRYIQHPITLKLVPAEEYVRPSSKLPEVQRDLKPFRSHVDGSMITSRSGLREHNRRNNVVHAEEFDFVWKKAQKERDAYYSGKPYDVEARTDAVKFAYELSEERRSEADKKQMIENYRRYNDGH